MYGSCVYIVGKVHTINIKGDQKMEKLLLDLTNLFYSTLHRQAPLMASKTLDCKLWPQRNKFIVVAAVAQVS